MKSTKTIQIPSPCYEKWSEMTVSEKGRFCSSCQKEVIDYTSKSSLEISRILNNSNETTCGRFNTNQLNTAIISETSNNFFKNLLQIAVSTLLTFSISNKVNGTNIYSPSKIYTNNLNDNQQIKVQPETKEDTIIKLKGIITDSETNEPLPFANVFIDELQLGTSADFNGKYELKVADSIEISKYTAIFSYVGYTTQTIVLSKLEDVDDESPIELNARLITSNNVTMGIICVEKKKKWWKRDKKKSKAPKSSNSD